MLCTSDDGVSNLKLYWWPHSGELRLVEDPEVRLDLLGASGGCCRAEPAGLRPR